MRRRVGIAAAAVWALTIADTRGWDERDFPPRPVVAYTFALTGGDASTVVGLPKRYTFAKGDTLYDIARHLGLGINEVTAAHPELDVWLPPEGASVAFPTWWVLPESNYRGIVVNIPEMRLYYFPASGGGGVRTVITYPVGLGREEWRTPTGRFTVTEKTVNPKWVIPASIRAEHIQEHGDTREFIAGGAPDNPLGRYRLRLSLPLYGIHGTNIPWGVGMEVSHGCIRLYPEDIQRLFPVVPIGTPGEIVYEPVKIGSRDGNVYVEVHRDVYNMGLDYGATAKELLRAKGWEDRVDWQALFAAVQEKSGVPTRISKGRSLRWRAAEEAQQGGALRVPRS